MRAAGRHGIMKAAVFEGLHHRLEPVRRRRHLQRPGAVQLDLTRRQAAGPQLVLQPADPQRVGAAVGQPVGDKVAAEALVALRRTNRPRRRQRDAATGIAGEPLQAVQAPAIAVGASLGGSRADVRPAMQLGRPGAAAQCVAIRARQLGQVGIPHGGGRDPVEHIGDGAGHRHRTVRRDVRLGQQVTHGERKQMRRLAGEGQADRAAAIGLRMANLVERIEHHSAQRRPVPVVGLEARRGVTISVGGLLVQPAAHPGTEVVEPVLMRGEHVRCQARQQAVQVRIDSEEIQPVRFLRQGDHDLGSPITAARGSA